MSDLTDLLENVKKNVYVANPDKKTNEAKKAIENMNGTLLSDFLNGIIWSFLGDVRLLCRPEITKENALEQSLFNVTIKLEPTFSELILINIYNTTKSLSNGSQEFKLRVEREKPLRMELIDSMYTEKEVVMVVSKIIAEHLGKESLDKISEQSEKISKITVDGVYRDEEYDLKSSKMIKEEKRREEEQENKKEWYIEDFYFYDSEKDYDVPIQNMSGHFFGETELAFTAFNSNACDFLKKRGITWKTTNPHLENGKTTNLIIRDQDHGDMDYGIKQIVVTQKDIEEKLNFTNETSGLKY